MTREEIKRKNDFKNSFKVLLKESIKKYNIKKKDYMLWTLKNEMIYSFFPIAYIRESDLKPIIEIWISYKPMWADDLLWDILDMQTNKKEPISLRVIGAFTMTSVTYTKKSIELHSDDIENMRNVLYTEIENFINSFTFMTEKMYINEMITSKTVSDIDKVLIHIYQGNLEEARKILKTTSDSGRFTIGNKSYKELVEKYLSNI